MRRDLHRARRAAATLGALLALGAGCDDDAIPTSAVGRWERGDCGVRIATVDVSATPDTPLALALPAGTGETVHAVVDESRHATLRLPSAVFPKALAVGGPDDAVTVAITPPGPALLAGVDDAVCEGPDGAVRCHVTVVDEGLALTAAPRGARLRYQGREVAVTDARAVLPTDLKDVASTWTIADTPERCLFAVPGVEVTFPDGTRYAGAAWVPKVDAVARTTPTAR